MKKRPILSALGVLFITFCLYQVYVFYIATNDNIQSIYLVPKDAVYVIETDQPVDNWATISESEIWQHLNTNDYFNTLAKNLNKLDSIFKEKESVFNRIGNRDVLVSAHVYAPKKYGFFYVVDLQKLSRLNVLKSHLNTVVNNNYKVSKRDYKTHEITEVYDNKTHETLYISFIKNQMIASYVHTLVEASIDQYLEPDIGRNLNFLEVKKEVDGDDMFRLYFQYDYLDEFVKVFSNKPNTLTTSISKSLAFSGFSFDLNKNIITANGITNVNPNAGIYLKALQKSGKGGRSISEIAPKQTALYLSFGFSRFSEFYENFEALQQENPEQFKSYSKGIEQVESFLKINIKRHFINWVDDEVALLQLHSSVSQSKQDVALVLKAKHKDDAKENLSFVLEQIRKRSPVKFKEINYKGYAINFMQIKGFFKLFLGGLFEDIEKPYFTIIDDYVVFSNHPNTLKSIINTYIGKETLINFEAFKDFEDRFENRSSMFAYINTSSLYNSAYQFVDNDTKKQLKANKDYFICFPQIGLQLTPENKFFRSKIVMQYDDLESVKNNFIFKEEKQYTSSYSIEITKENLNKNTVFNVAELYPTDLTAKTFTKNYANGKPHIIVELKDGLKHGKYQEFYPNGILKISGKYRKDKPIGLWKAYNLNEDLVYKDRL